MIKRIFSILTVVLAGMSLWALDLPVKEVNGKPYYYYVIKKGDTLYSLSTRFGITRQQLIASNPAATGLLKAGETLYFSVEEFGDGKPYVVEREPQEEPMPAGRVEHLVKKGETLYGISRRYGVSQDQIVELNPRVRNGVKTGMIIVIPVAETQQEEAVEDSMTPQTVTVAETDGAVPESDGAVPESDDEISDDEPAVELTVARESSIAVMLPFMLEAETPSKQALLYTDFYKGLLLAADTLSNRGDSLKIYAYDTMGDINRLKSLLSEAAVRDASVIIAPDDERHFALIADAVAGSDTKVINVFNMRDSLFRTKGNVVQTNIPHRLMYSKAFDAMDRLYHDYLPVILVNESGRSDKAEFISFIRNAYSQRGIEPLELTYDGALLNSQVETLPDDGGKYLIIPSSGALNEFNKFVHAIKTVRESSADKRHIELFGYPDWTAFRGDAESMLHAVGATVFSRFYYSPDSFDTRSLNRAFDRWFGTDMMEGIPNHAVLGFDIGNMIIRNLFANDGRFEPLEGRYVGVQSSFEFIRPGDSDDAGFCNDDVYILRFGPENKVERLNF